MWRRLATSVLLLVLAGTLAVTVPVARGGRRQGLPRAPVGRPERLLVVVPHPDDEVVGAGSLLLHARRALVVVLTSGDAFPAAAVAESPWTASRRERFRRLGRRRLAEFRRALRAVAPKAEAALLGYPDRSLDRLVGPNLHVPHRSPYTGAKAVPYRAARGFGEPQTGEALVRRLAAVMATWRPDVVALPSGLDRHPDHQAAAALVRLASGGQPHRPRLIEYLVHQPGWPDPAGLTPAVPLEPPEALREGAGLTWYRDPLSPRDRFALLAALLRHVTQVRVVGPFLFSFVKANGLYLTSAPLAPGRPICEPLASRARLHGSTLKACIGLAEAGRRLRLTGIGADAGWQAEVLVRTERGVKRHRLRPAAGEAAVRLPPAGVAAVLRVEVRAPGRGTFVSSWRSLDVSTPSGPRGRGRA